MFERYREIQERRAAGEADEMGFTLIELLIVIVVLGILAATVVFALGGVTGQSAVAACNSDAKTAEIAVQAYIASPDNATNTPPVSTGELVAAPFTSGGGPSSAATATSTPPQTSTPSTATPDTFMTASTNSAYSIALGAEPGPQTDSPAPSATSDGVFVKLAGATGSNQWVQYDNPSSSVNPCAHAT